jgi:hypothetical protein
MATMTKQRKKAEQSRADEVITVLTAIEAGDHKPNVLNYFMSGCLAKFETEQLREAKNWPELRSVPPSKENGVVFSTSRGLTHLLECEPVDAERRRRLAGVWGKVVTQVPEKLCCVTSVYINPITGVVGERRRDYRWLPPGASRSSGDNWFPFPLNEAGHVVGYARDKFGCRVPIYDTAAGSGSEHDHSCSMAPTYTRLFEVLQERYWTVSLAAFGCQTRLTLFTSSDGVKGFFDLREKGANGRRNALQHWVRQHTRKIGGGDVADVKRHLRGLTEFDWFGLRGSVRVPTQCCDGLHTATINAKS